MATELQKASIVKRIAAALLDFILLSILITGFAALLAGICGYDSYLNTVDEMRVQYESQYGVDFDITQEAYDAMTDQQRQNYDTAAKALSQNEQFLQAYSMQVSLTVLITTFSILLSVMILEFALPLFLKNGQTLGKKVFGIAVIRTDGVQASKMQLFIRALLGKFTVELMIPVYIVILLFFNTADIFSLAILAALLLGELICVAATHTNALLHDLLAGTVAADLSSQMIFRSSEDLMEYTKKIHAERANRSEY